MKSALVGHTGFVGGNLAQQHQFDEYYNSKNIEDIAGRTFDVLVLSAMPAAMWIANKDPVADRAVLDRLLGCLRDVTAHRVIVMSTVAVFPKPIAVDESSPITESEQMPYGRHRLMLEHEIAKQFGEVLVVRLPGLFGPGLKKNAIYDLLYSNETHKINAASVYQFYNLERLWADVQTALRTGLKLIHLNSEPVSVREVAREVFDLDFQNDPGTPAARFDMYSQHAAVYGLAGHYLYSREQVLAELRDFVERERQNAGAS
jgi:nucleoside-diphosphate-sugar epimerase